MENKEEKLLEIARSVFPRDTFDGQTGSLGPAYREGYVKGATDQQAEFIKLIEDEMEESLSYIRTMSLQNSASGNDTAFKLKYVEKLTDLLTKYQAL